MIEYYTSVRLIDCKPIRVIVDENGNIVNRNPSKYELKGIEKEPYKMNVRNRSKKYADEELDYHLIRFYVENGRPPTRRDFINNPGYPSEWMYRERFESWANGLKRVGLDVDSMVKLGVLETSNQKARLAEIKVVNHFIKHPIDLAGENCNSSCDGICPNGKTYDVKSSKLYTECKYWFFHTDSKYKEEIEIYYLLAFNEDYTELEHGWRIPEDIAEKDYLLIGLNGSYEFNVENMKKYDITDKFKNIIKKINEE
jgi:hypothetical protein